MSQKPLVLYGSPTPNGVPITILLEELKAIYPGIDYDVDYIDLSKQRHKEPWFLELNPNGLMPVLVDRSRNNFVVFESTAILVYIAQHYDKESKFSFDPAKSPNEYSVLLQWLFFLHGGLGPMQGQAYYFYNIAPEDIPYGKKRYTDETKRLFGVLEQRLKDREYLAGPGKGQYTIADIKAWPWVSGHAYTGIQSLDEWPLLKAWSQKCSERAANAPAREAFTKPQA
ncbi:hypothetical protein M378DRAFT_170338 [Amanita muscaria Koide BX008]|uniref:Glutathione S-transferase n=1 Tax=Amanita muscaria (strain Koide BX008) TaxID=946122 RepID=A0A0C2WQX7_AMAMK|nr:hypothetical protein M378DRAFT_170338 [Amanita muscaria Koide BX008]